LDFGEGLVMKDSENLLEGDGIKMRHIKIFQDSTINSSAISDFIKQALQLNQDLGNPTK
jgi:hypothetical protein